MTFKLETKNRCDAKLTVYFVIKFGIYWKSFLVFVYRPSRIILLFRQTIQTRNVYDKLYYVTLQYGQVTLVRLFIPYYSATNFMCKL